MSLADVLKRPLRRLVPHEGLVIDVPTWNAAHDYHIYHQRLHALAMHSPGVITGLEVVAWEPPGNSIVINPGIAVDAEGRTIIMGEPQRFQLRTGEPGTVYLTVQYREVSDNTDSSAEEDSQVRHVQEAYLLEERRQPPDGPYIELARVQISGTGATVSDARNPHSPAADEIDTRYRMVSGPQPLGYINIGVVPLEVTPDGQIPHAAGVMSLVQVINATTRYHAEFKGSINLNQEIVECDLLIMAGQQEFVFPDDWVLVISRFLERGGVILGEPSGAETADDSVGPTFPQAFLNLAERLGRDLTVVERGHPMFSAHHIFSQAPAGINDKALLVEADGVVYSDANYGSLWSGGISDEPASRETIRSATELGTNIAIFASRRTQMRAAKVIAQ